MPLSPPPAIPVELMEKTLPKQQRAIRTYERILESAALLLDEVGVERISTNLIAVGAEVTIPALYRYFSNKYAILYALGARLMDRQNEVMLAWHERYGESDDTLAYLDNIEELLHETLRVTREQTAGLAILRAMRAVPVLQEIGLKSHYSMSEWAASVWAEQFGIEATSTLTRHLRLTLELGSQTVEMTLEDPDMPADFAFREYGTMMRLYWGSVLDGVQ